MPQELKFRVGDRVMRIVPIGSLLPEGLKGTVVSHTPLPYADTFVWRIEYDNGMIGWSRETSNELTTEQALKRVKEGPQP